MICSTTDSFRKETSDCLYEWIIKRFTQTFCLTILIRSKIKQMTIYMVSHWIVHSTNLFENTDSLRTTDCLYESLNHSFNWLVQQLIYSGTKQVEESLNHSLSWFDSYRNTNFCVAFETQLRHNYLKLHTNFTVKVYVCTFT